MGPGTGDEIVNIEMHRRATRITLRYLHGVGNMDRCPIRLNDWWVTAWNVFLWNRISASRSRISQMVWTSQYAGIVEVGRCAFLNYPQARLC